MEEFTDFLTKLLLRKILLTISNYDRDKYLISDTITEDEKSEIVSVRAIIWLSLSNDEKEFVFLQ